MSAQTQLAGLDVISGWYYMTLSGAAVGQVTMGGDALALGPTELTIAGDGEPDSAFRVCVARVASIEGRLVASIVAGRSGGLSASPLAVDVPALHYDGSPTPATAWEVLSDVAMLAGEIIDPALEGALQAYGATSWLRESGPARHAFARAAAHWGLSWRFLPSGDLWVGAETWPLIATEPQIVDPIDTTWALHVAPRGGSVLPGLTIQGRRALRVELRFGDALRASVYYRDDP